MQIKSFIIAAMFVLFTQSSYASRMATSDDIALLKSDILEGKIKTGKTRLKSIQTTYGEPQNIQDAEKKIIYDYDDLKIEFTKKYYLRDWQYDYSHKTAYSEDINQLRKDLESGEVVGSWVELNDDIISDYGKPTDVFIKAGDGERSNYYWGEMRLSFENFYVISNIRGQKLSSSTNVSEEVVMENGVLSSGANAAEAPNKTPETKTFSAEKEEVSVSTVIQ